MTLIEVNMRFIDVSPGDISSNRLLFAIEAGGHRISTIRSWEMFLSVFL